jgi:DNA-binding transcriptional MerR regulator
MENPKEFYQPVYNIKAVAQLVGLLPVTLRAWERRYGLPTPGRGDQGYRLYSEYDVRTLRWLKNQLDSGMSISRAVTYLNDLRTKGRDPAEPAPQASGLEPASFNAFRQNLLSSLRQFDDTTANDIFRRAFAIYSVDQVLSEIVKPMLVEVGEAWHRGELAITTEHYITQFCTQHLMSMLGASSSPTRHGTIVAAGAPGEMHQIGLLMLVVMLRWRGWDVKYLGPDLKLDMLEEALRPLHPNMILFTATRLEAAQNLSVLPEVLKRFRPISPLVVLGGSAFKSYRLPENPLIHYLDDVPTQTIASIEALLLQASPEFIY